MRIKGLSRSVLALGASAIAIGAVPALSATAASSAGGTGTVHQSAVNSAHPGTGSAGTSNNLSYHGGVPGVEIGGDKVYLVYWGSQWNNNDTSGEAAIQQKLLQRGGRQQLEQLRDAVLPGRGDRHPILQRGGNRGHQPGGRPRGLLVRQLDCRAKAPDTEPARQ